MNISTMMTTAVLNRTAATLPFTGCDNYTDNGGQIAYAIFLAFVLLFCILGNSLVCIAIALSPRLREKPTNYFIISLAVSDMCYAISQCPIRISKILHNQVFCFDINVCRFFILTDLITTPATIITLLVVAIDRFFCITKPFFYQQHMTKTKAMVIIACIWSYSCLWSSLSFISWQSPPVYPTIFINKSNHVCVITNQYFYMTSYFVVIIVPLFIMAVAYLAILRVAVVQIRAIHATEVHVPQESNDMDNKRDARMSKSPRRNNRELRATATLAIVYGAFFVCWFPPSVLNIYIGFEGPAQLIQLQQTNLGLFEFIFYTFAEILPTLSTAINPIIYNVFNRQFRTAFKAVFFRIAGRSDILRRSTIARELELTTNRRATIDINN